MSYNRPPTAVIAGRAMTQTPEGNNPPGVLSVTLDNNIATTSSLGVVEVGSGLSITSSGVLSASGSGSLINVHLTAVNYTATLNDYYVGATKNGITITLPNGVVGKVYMIKNQNTGGNIVVQGSSGQNIDNSSSRILGSSSGIILVFDGTRWNTV